MCDDGVDVDGGGSDFGRGDDRLDGGGRRRVPLHFSADGVLVVSLAGIVVVLTPAGRKERRWWTDDGSLGPDEGGAAKSSFIDDGLLESRTLGGEVLDGELGGALAVAVFSSFLRDVETGQLKAVRKRRSSRTLVDRGIRYPSSSESQ